MVTNIIKNKLNKYNISYTHNTVLNQHSFVCIPKGNKCFTVNYFDVFKTISVFTDKKMFLNINVNELDGIICEYF